MGDTKKNNDEKKESDSSKKSKEKFNFRAKVWPYIRIFLVLGLVILVIYGLSVILKKSLNIKGKVGDGASVILNHSLGMGKWVQVVNIGGKYLILGITNDRITLLSEIKDPKEIERFDLIQNEKKVSEGKTFVDIAADFIRSKVMKKTGPKKFDYEVDSINFLKDQKKRIDDMNEE